MTRGMAIEVNRRYLPADLAASPTLKKSAREMSSAGATILQLNRAD